MKKMISVLCAIGLCVLIPLTVVFFNTKQFFRSENINKVIKKMSVTEMAKKDSDAGRALQSSLNTIYSTASTYGVSEDVVNTVIESDVVKEFIADSIGSVSDYIMTGNNRPIISKEEFQVLFRKSVEETIIGAKLDINPEQKEAFIAYVNQNTDKVIEVLPKAADVAAELDLTQLETIQGLFTDQIGYLLIGGTAFLTILILILMFKERKWLWYLAIPLFVSALGIFFASLFVPGILQVLSDKMDPVALLFTETFLSSYTYHYIWIGFLLVGAAVILGATYQILKLQIPKKEITNA